MFEDSCWIFILKCFNEMKTWDEKMIFSLPLFKKFMHMLLKVYEVHQHILYHILSTILARVLKYFCFKSTPGSGNNIWFLESTDRTVRPFIDFFSYLQTYTIKRDNIYDKIFFRNTPHFYSFAAWLFWALLKLRYLQ